MMSKVDRLYFESNVSNEIFAVHLFFMDGHSLYDVITISGSNIAKDLTLKGITASRIIIGHGEFENLCISKELQPIESKDYLHTRPIILFVAPDHKLAGTLSHIKSCSGSCSFSTCLTRYGTDHYACSILQEHVGQLPSDGDWGDFVTIPSKCPLRNSKGLKPVNISALSPKEYLHYINDFQS